MFFCKSSAFFDITGEFIIKAIKFDEYFCDLYSSNLIAFIDEVKPDVGDNNNDLTEIKVCDFVLDQLTSF